jgi:hypothetical protein
MDKTFYLISIFFIFVVCWLLQEENQLWDQQRQILKAGNNKAVHASLFPVESLNAGTILLPENAAFQAYKESLEENLGLDEMLQPKPGSPVLSQIRILHFEVIDEHSGRQFPFLYENSEYHLAKYLRGPAVVAVIEMDFPRIQTFQFTIRVPSIYEYARADI